MMHHIITEQDVDSAMQEATVHIASSSSAEGHKRLVYNHGRAMFVLTVNGEFLLETSDQKDAAAEYSATIK